MVHLRFRRQNASRFSFSGHHMRAGTVRILPAILACLAVMLSPTLVQAAPPPALLAQTTLYEDPDGRFSLNVPNEFIEVQPITYEMVGDNPLSQLLDSTGVLIADPETQSGVSVLFLLLNQEITNWDDFAGFIASFQVAAGGDTLSLVDFKREAGDALVASGSAATRDRQLQVRIEADGDVVSILSTSVERARYRELRSALSDAFDSYTWDPVNVGLSLLLGSPSDEGSVADEPANEEPAQEEPVEEELPPAEEPGAEEAPNRRPSKHQRVYASRTHPACFLWRSRPIWKLRKSATPTMSCIVPASTDRTTMRRLLWQSCLHLRPMWPTAPRERPSWKRSTTKCGISL
jgi:hypothetical protein